MTGQSLLTTLANWIGEWIVFSEVPQGQNVIVALWCLHTWFAPQWPATAYLHLTSAAPGCGKSTLLEVAASLALNPKMRATLRPLEVVRAIEAVDSRVTYFFDEVEKLSSAGASDMRSILTTGYKQGGTHGISVGARSVEFSTYCAKAFASIGGLDDVFRSRSIMISLSYGNPERSWTDCVMGRKGEAERLLSMANTILASAPEWTPPTWIQGREREIWTPLWSVALALGLDGSMLMQIRRTVDDLIALKMTTENKGYKDLRTEPKDAETAYAEAALRDLAAVLPAPVGNVSGHLWTVHAIEKMKAGNGPWRTIKGTGLTPDLLASLVGRFGIGPEVVREGRGRASKAGKGYHRTHVLKALALLDGESK